MKLRDWIAVLESVAPPELALDWDNTGLLVGPEKDDIRSVLVALDCTPQVAREAVSMDTDMVLTHHPQFFRPVSRLLWDAPDTAAACVLLRHGIGHYAAHTNLDAANGGVNDVLSGLFGVNGLPFGSGIGRVGALPEPERLAHFAARIGRELDTVVRIVGEPQTIIRRAAFVGGAGGMDLAEARAVGADVLVTGEIKHNEALDALTMGLACVVAGHDETERIILKPLIERLQGETDDVQYTLAQADKRPLVAV